MVALYVLISQLIVMAKENRELLAPIAIVEMLVPILPITMMEDIVEAITRTAMALSILIITMMIQEAMIVALVMAKNVILTKADIILTRKDIVPMKADIVLMEIPLIAARVMAMIMADIILVAIHPIVARVLTTRKTDLKSSINAINLR